MVCYTDLVQRLLFPLYEHTVRPPSCARQRTIESAVVMPMQQTKPTFNTVDPSPDRYRSAGGRFADVSAPAEDSVFLGCPDVHVEVRLD